MRPKTLKDRGENSINMCSKKLPWNVGLLKKHDIQTKLLVQVKGYPGPLRVLRT